MICRYVLAVVKNAHITSVYHFWSYAYISIADGIFAI